MSLTSTRALPDTVLQEIRNALAVVCREIVMKDGAEGKKEEQQDQMMEKVFLHNHLERHSPIPLTIRLLQEEDCAVRNMLTRHCQRPEALPI